MCFYTMQLIHYISPTAFKCCLIFLMVNIPLYQPKIGFIFNHSMPFNAAHRMVLKFFTN